MRSECFFDTNVLIYAFADDDPRAGRAESLLEEGGVLGVQVLNEFVNVTRRKLNWDWKQVDAALAVVTDLLGDARPLTLGIHVRAIELARAHTIAFYDALIVSAAEDAKCRVLYSEDLQHGRQFRNVQVQNPFA